MTQQLEEEKKTAGGQPMSDYWKNAWQEAQERELKAQKKVNKQLSEIRSLTVGLNSMRAQRNRFRKEANNLRKKLAGLEEAARSLMDETEMDGEGKWLRNLRTMVWNQADSDEVIRIEGYDKS